MCYNNYMEKKFLKLNSLMYTVLLFLISWAIAVICTLPSQLAVDFADYFFIISLIFFINFVVTYQIIIKKKYSLLPSYDKNCEYCNEIFNYNLYYCNNIIGSCALFCDLMLCILYTTLICVGNFSGLKIAMPILFAFCLALAIIPSVYKNIQMRKYIIDTNKVFIEWKK